MKFSYSALTSDSKKITGVLEAESRNAAQMELHKMGVAILSLNEISEEEYEKLRKEQEELKVQKGISTFVFVAIDPNGKEIDGTIDERTVLNAFRRLRTEYHFKLKDLYAQGASEEEKKKGRGRLQEYETLIAMDIKKLEAESRKKEMELESEEGEMNQELIADIDRLILKTKKVMEGHRALFSNDLIKEISDTLGELERIRTSNNVRHITEVSGRLYELISHPDITQGEGAEADRKGLEKEMGDIKESLLFKKESDLYKRAVEIAGAQKLFKSIALRLSELTGGSKKRPEEKGFFDRLRDRIHRTMKAYGQKKRPETAPQKSKTPSLLGQTFKNLFGLLTAKTSALRKVKKEAFLSALKGLFAKKEKEELEPEEEMPIHPEEKPAGVEKEKAESPALAGEEEEGVQEKIAKKKQEAEAIEEEIKTISREKLKTVKEGQKPEKPILLSLEVKKKPEEKKEEKREKRDFTVLFVEADSFTAWLLCFYITYFFLVDFSLEKNIGLNPDFVFKTLKSPLILNISILLLFIHFSLRFRNLHFRGNALASLFLLFLTFGIYIMVVANF